MPARASFLLQSALRKGVGQVDRKTVVNLVGALIGLALLLSLAFYLSTLFASRTSKLSSPLHLSTPQQSLLDTKDWLTYNSSRHQFSIKYPPTWSVRELADDPFVYFAPPTPTDSYSRKVVSAQIGVRVFPKGIGISLDEWLDQEVARQPRTSMPIERKSVQIGTTSVREVSGLPSGGPELTYFTTLDDQVVMLSGGPYPPNDPSGGWQNVEVKPSPDELRSVLQTMVSTLTSY